MEFTVSRADLVRELNLSQGVVEKKTTIPILSNVLVETDGDSIHLYYGAGDSCMAMATGSIRALLSWLDSNSSAEDANGS